MLAGHRSRRVLVSAAFALGLISLPLVQIAACSCAMGETDAQIRSAPLAFMGTVVDQRATGARNPIGDTMVQSAFEVERASAPTNALTVIAAGTSGASCGITFATGEEWLVIVPESSEMGDTHLCAGNIRLSDISAEERADIEALLPVIPEAAPSAEPAGPLSESMLPVLVVGAAVLGIVAIGVLAFRRQGAR